VELVNVDEPVGLVVGTVAATPLQFSVAVRADQYLQLDDVVTTSRQLPGQDPIRVSGVVTNVEAEHLEHYGGRFERVLEAYAAFLSGLRPGGRAVLWAGDPRLVELGRRWGGEVRLYGEEGEAQVRAVDVAVAPGGGSQRRPARVPVGDRALSLLCPQF